MKTKITADQNRNSSGQESGAISQLGEELLKKYPEMVAKAASENKKEPSARVLEIVNDLLPYVWKEPRLFADGLGHCFKGNYREAIEAFQDILRLEPDAYPVYHFLGYARGKTGNVKGEIEYYRKAAKLNPDYPQIYCSLGAAYWTMGKEKKALEAFKQAVSLANDFSLLDYWLTFVIGGMRPVSKVNGQDGKERRGNILCHANVCCMLGNVYVEFGLHSAARQAYKRAARIKPDFAEAYYQLGHLHIKRLRNPKRARKYLQKSEQLFTGQNDLQKAAQARHLICPRDEIQDKDKAAEEWLKDGLRLQRVGRYLSAIDSYREAISFKPDFLDAYYNIGVAYGSLQDAGLQKISNAIGPLKQAIRLKPDFIHAYIALGASYIKAGNHEDAVQTLNKALEYEPKNPDIYYYLGQVFRLTGKPEQAIEALKMTISIHPDSVQARYLIGLAFLDAGQYDDAGEAFQEALRIKPDFADVHFMLGSLYQSPLANNERSLFHLKKAEKLYAKLEDYQNSARARQLLEHPPA